MLLLHRSLFPHGKWSFHLLTVHSTNKPHLSSSYLPGSAFNLDFMLFPAINNKNKDNKSLSNNDAAWFPGSIDKDHDDDDGDNREVEPLFPPGERITLVPFSAECCWAHCSILWRCGAVRCCRIVGSQSAKKADFHSDINKIGWEGGEIVPLVTGWRFAGLTAGLDGRLHFIPAAGSLGITDNYGNKNIPSQRRHKTSLDTFLWLCCDAKS